MYLWASGDTDDNVRFAFFQNVTPYFPVNDFRRNLMPHILELCVVATGLSEMLVFIC
jgi:hypothetical protein